MEHDTAGRIVAIAIPLFAKKGYTAVTIREVGEAAQINSSAISYYFKSKEGLYQAVLEKSFLPVAELFQRVDSLSGLNPVERIELYAQTIGKIHQEQPFLARIIHSELANPTSCGERIIKKYISMLYQFVSSSLREGVHSGAFAPGLNLSYAALSLAGIMNFYFLVIPLVKEFVHLSEDSDQEYIMQALKIYLDGVNARP
ncbi:DenO|uniref:Transcriptional regulator, TetR family n=1 Tax=Dendrosporobacter quercicolus TaxID=146817 RepID=A0A1G9P0I9_9FIRM|nr:TetR family transcriptional regulator [Dendrosporobacter quercicolus]NSL47492.1 DenO [Dendrosporobacter quercicolus DSM 1736]SDL91735.1 transcriptional regulator, TetR family [Dendrosporobacter quercicolus]